MPIYEYRCRNCGQVFSRWFRTMRAIEGDSPPACPTCASEDVQRLISQVAVLSGSNAGSDDTPSGESASESKPPVFGRKELNQIVQKRKRLGLD